MKKLFNIAKYSYFYKKMFLVLHFSFDTSYFEKVLHMKIYVYMYISICVVYIRKIMGVIMSFG